MAEQTNIWNVSRFLIPEKMSSFSKVPPLIRSDDSVTEDEIQIIRELLGTFFPPLPDASEAEPERASVVSVEDPEITLEEVRVKVFSAKPWKAPGSDGLPSAVWQQMWPEVKDDILDLFRASLNEGYLPWQWRVAKIIPLKKPNKPDYHLARAWRPISLSATLGKILESVIAERISYVAETYNLLPENHFGARRRRSAEQALILLQEYIYKAWRGDKVLSLISFDVKGGYNGVSAPKLIQRMRARGIPERWLRWIFAFCSNRSASVVLNGHESNIEELLSPGIPQGSPLSPILFLFYNADLVEQQISNAKGAVAFVDDYTSWVTGESAEANLVGIREVIKHALTWERRSGATFEEGKTALIHFTRNRNLQSTTPINVKDIDISPSSETKILGVIMDSQLRFKTHIQKASSKGLKAALALKRMHVLTSASARQLFNATVAPVVDYASAVWMHAVGPATTKTIRQIQKLGGQAITGAFGSVACAVAEAEAYIRPVKARQWDRALKLLIDLFTLPAQHPLSWLAIRPCSKFKSPLQRISEGFQGIRRAELEKIEPYVIAPWEPKITYNRHVQTDSTDAAEILLREDKLLFTTTAVENKNGTAFGCTQASRYASIAIGERLDTRRAQNLYIAELQAVATTLKNARDRVPPNSVILLTSTNLAVLEVLSNPKQQSGQYLTRAIYGSRRYMEQRGIRLQWMWIPATTPLSTRNKAKEEAHKALDTNKNNNNNNNHPNPLLWSAKASVFSRAMPRLKCKRALPNGVGKAIRELDTALPGKHTKAIYDALNKRDAKILIQLRTGCARINQYLARIKAIDSPLCSCGAAPESLRHFLFSCSRWVSQRRELYEKWPGKEGNLRFFVGAKATNDGVAWSPELEAIRAVINYTKATARFEIESE